jgi:hypothetical protein
MSSSCLLSWQPWLVLKIRMCVFSALAACVFSYSLLLSTMTTRAPGPHFCASSAVFAFSQLPSNSLIAKRIAMFSPEDAPSNREPGNGRSVFSIERTFHLPLCSGKHAVMTYVSYCIA